jgi:N-acetylglucosamine-6-phosphate deacetylase
VKNLPRMKHGEICAWHYATRQPIRLRWQDGVISHLEPASPPPPGDLWLAPPLFDLQINGYGGVDFQQDNVTGEDMLAACRKLRAAGCTRFLLTLITDEWLKLTARLRHLRALRAQSAELRSAIAGWHVEGPFLSSEPGFHGAHDPALMRDPTPEHILELRSITGDDPLLLTLAPERFGALKAIELATARRIKISLGHTNASGEVLRQAVAAGATGFTHLGNACGSKLNKHDNILWRVFETPGLTASLIPDRIHVSPALFRVIHRVLEPERIYYTTDAMSAAGAPPGKYQIWKYEVEVGADQIVRQPGGDGLAGSALRPIDGIFRAAEMLGCDWQEVWPRFSENPARLMGFGCTLEPGQPANFCVLQVARGNQLTELKVFAGGSGEQPAARSDSPGR